MAVRCYTREQLYAELEKAGFTPTREITDYYTIWKDKAGNIISVNHTEISYPYSYLSSLLACCGIEYNPSGAIVDMQTYKVTH